MKQFISGHKTAFQSLEQRAKSACVRFRKLGLPYGCTPQKADIGFEIDPVSGSAILWVERGIQYIGQDVKIKKWLEAGKLEFGSFTDLKHWIKGPLAVLINNNQKPQNHDLSHLTDMSTIQKSLNNIENVPSLDEDVLYADLSTMVRGQKHALEKLTRIVIRHCARKTPSRPAVVFAVGPSGVGKTRTAETLATILRNMDEHNAYGFLRLDMTEYQESYRISQLIGSPQGYVGHSDGSQLLDALDATPRLIVLFDEIEKAHPSILKVLMNAMDVGRLSSASRLSGSHEVDCRSAIFMFTSNLDSKEILKTLESRDGFGKSEIENEVCRNQLHSSGIAPEIIGRIATFLVFKPLTVDIKAEIMALAITEVAQEYGLEITQIAPEVIIELINKLKNRSDNFGVRPERFFIDELLGGCFVKTVQNGVANPVQLSGSPYECKTVKS